MVESEVRGKRMSASSVSCKNIGELKEVAKQMR